MTVHELEALVTAPRDLYAKIGSKTYGVMLGRRTGPDTWLVCYFKRRWLAVVVFAHDLYRTREEASKSPSNNYRPSM